MTALHLVFLVEEPSSEAFLRALLPRILPDDRSFDIHPFQGKADLLGKLEARLRGFAAWLPDDWRLFVLVDRDDEDCVDLKSRLEAIAERVQLRSKTRSRTGTWQIVNRLAIEELEAWYFSDWKGVRAAYPKASSTIAGKQGFRNPDAVAGGTWEAFERIMQKHGYFTTGLRKIEAARSIGGHFDPTRSSSQSFRCFRAAIAEALV